jgi:stage II sporulation protein D
VGLAWDLDSLTIDPVGAAALSGATEGASLDPAERIHVRLTHSGAAARVLGGRSQRQYTIWPADTLVIDGADGDPDDPARFIRWGGKSWRGEFRVFLNPRRKLTLACRLPLERYLLGVLPGEIGPLGDDLLEAGRAQAIAARSYTMFYRGRRGAEGFDVYATVEDQVYGPVETEKPLATRCVESTTGEVALFGGAPIRANYFSTCGGITADVWEAWPTPPLPYLVSHRDRERGEDFCGASPHYRWREEWTASQFLSSLRNFGPTYGVRLPPGGLGELLDVFVESRSRSGRVWWLTVETSHGEVRIPAYSLRQVLRRPGNPAAILRSTLFKIDVRRDPRSRRAIAVVASGAGSGHGVGLCQTGALGMARTGHKGEAIILHYFPGVDVERSY